LERENAQLRRAVVSHAVVDQAIGVLVAFYRIPPAAGVEVLREVSPRTNVKLHAVAKRMIGWALGRPLPPRVSLELQAAVTPLPGPERPGARTGGPGHGDR
jgi:hypothetical protein